MRADSHEGTMAFLLCLNWVHLLVDMLMIMMQVSADSHFPNGLAHIYVTLQCFMQKCNNAYMYARTLRSSVPALDWSVIHS